MRIFPGWRAVGRAMLEARRREGVTVMRGGLTPWTRITWFNGDLGVSVWFRPDRSSLELTAELGTGCWINRAVFSNAGQVLRVLAALDLIPAHLAEGPDERYGRCATCGRVARWWSYLGQPRWVHIQPWAVTGPAPHRAEVAG